MLKINYKLASIIIILSLIGALSIFGESRDYEGYLRYFNILGNGQKLEDLYSGYIRVQIGFKYLNQVLYNISDSFKFYLFVVAFFSLVPKFFLINYYSKNKFISILTYLLLIYPLHELNQIRLGLGLGLLFFSIHLYKFKKFIKSLFFLILASSIHIFSIPLFIGTLSLDSIDIFFKKGKISKNNILTLIIFLLIIIFALIFGIFKFNIFYYLSSDQMGSLFSLRTFLLLSITIIGIRYKKYFPEHIRIWHNLSILGLISYYVLIFSMDLSHRIIQTSYFSYIIWIEYLPVNARLVSRYILLFVGLTTFILVLNRQFI